MYMIFMILLALSLHWYFINGLREKKRENFTLIKFVLLFNSKTRCLFIYLFRFVDEQYFILFQYLN